MFQSQKAYELPGILTPGTRPGVQLFTPYVLCPFIVCIWANISVEKLTCQEKCPWFERVIYSQTHGEILDILRVNKVWNDFNASREIKYTRQSCKNDLRKHCLSYPTCIQKFNWLSYFLFLQIPFYGQENMRTYSSKRSWSLISLSSATTSGGAWVQRVSHRSWGQSLSWF